MTRPSRERRCPVCELPVPAALPVGTRCARCGWPLRGPETLGDLTTAVVRSFDEALRAARRGYDLRAVARAEAALAAAEPSIAAALCGAARGGPPTPGELDEPREAQRRSPAGRGPILPTLTSTLNELLKQVGPAGDRHSPRPALLDLGADAVVLSVLEKDDLGQPVTREAARWSWPEVLPGLPADRYVRLLRLAGGIGSAELGAPALGGAGDAALAGAVAVVAAAARSAGVTELAVVSWLPADWPLPEEFAARLAVPGPAACAARLERVRAWPGESVDAVLGGTATAYDYGLVVADVDERTRGVTLGTELLFAAGCAVTPGAPLTADLEVTTPKGAVELVLAIVARPAGATRNPRGWRPLALGRSAVRPGERLRVTVALESARRVRFSAPAGLRAVRDSELTWEWTALLDTLPVAHGARPTDVVLLLELGARRDQPGRVEERLRTARRLLELIDREHPDASTVRVTVIGYLDHEPVRDRGRPVLRKVLARPPREAAAALTGWRAGPWHEDAVAPLEDALRAAAELPWRPPARAVLVTFGERVPHRPRLRDATTPCPHEHDWEEAMKDLVTRVAPTRVAVIERGAAPSSGTSRQQDRARAAWSQLGADGTLTAPVGERAVADEARLLVDAAPLPVPGAALSGIAGPPPGSAGTLRVPVRAAGTRGRR